MKYQIDQSGKIEQLSKHTVLCLANDNWNTVMVKAGTKRQIQEIFRRHGQTRNFVLFTFSAAVSLLIKRNSKILTFTIDREYHEKEAVIKAILLEMLRNVKTVPEINFRQIGRKAKAHKFAYLTFTKKEKPTIILEFKELLAAIKMTEVGKRLKDT